MRRLLIDDWNVYFCRENHEEQVIAGIPGGGRRDQVDQN